VIAGAHEAGQDPLKCILTSQLRGPNHESLGLNDYIDDGLERSAFGAHWRNIIAGSVSEADNEIAPVPRPGAI